jgi:hypothetical protein
MPTSSPSGRRIGLEQSDDYVASATAAKRSKNAARSESVEDFLHPLDFEMAHSALTDASFTSVKQLKQH